MLYGPWLGECLRHVYDMPMAAGNATSANWLAFNQSEFQGDKEVGFGELGWVYVPSRCQNLNDEGPGSAPCKLVVRPGKCSPPTFSVGCSTKSASGPSLSRSTAP